MVNVSDLDEQLKLLITQKTLNSTAILNKIEQKFQWRSSLRI